MLFIRVLQIVKTTRTFWLSQVFGPPKFHKIQNWTVSGRLQNPIPKTKTQFWEFLARLYEFLDFHEYFARFWTSKSGFGNRVSEPSQNRPVWYRSANWKKFKFCRALLFMWIRPAKFHSQKVVVSSCQLSRVLVTNLSCREMGNFSNLNKLSIHSVFPH
jgi:hypothetical protein